MPGGGHDHVVGQAVDVGEQFPVDAAVGDRRGQIVGRVRPPVLGQLVEVGEEVHQRLQLLFRRGAALVLLLVAAEQFLGQLQHPGEVGLGQAQQRHDDVEREVDGHLGDEVALRSHLGHLVDVVLGQLVDAALQRAHCLGAEPVRADGAHLAVVRVVHVDQRAQAHPRLQLRLGQVVGLGGRQQRPGLAQPQVVGPLDVHDVGVLGDREERPVRRLIHPRHRVVRAQPRQRRVQPVVVGVRRRIRENLCRLVHCPSGHPKPPSSVSVLTASVADGCAACPGFREPVSAASTGWAGA